MPDDRKAQSFDGMIVNAFFELKTDFIPVVTSQMISEQMEKKGIKDKEGRAINPRSIGRHLKILGLETKSQSIAGKTYRVIIEDEETLASLKRKYVFEEKEVVENAQQKIDV